MTAPTTRACTANRCQQGRTPCPCPCPQACELPADPLQDERMTQAETVLAVLVATLLAVVIFAAFMAAVA